MRTLLIRAVLVALLTALSALAWAEDPPRTYTNEDLKPVRNAPETPIYSNEDLPEAPETAAGYSNQDLPELPAGDPPSEAIEPDPIDPGSIMTLSNYVDVDGNGREYWQNRMLDWEVRKRENARAIVEESGRLRNYLRLAVRLSEQDYFDPELQRLNHYVQQSKERLDELKAARADLEDEEARIALEARRARALGSWLAIDPRVLRELDETIGVPDPLVKSENTE